MSQTGDAGDDASSRAQVSRRDVVTLLAGIGIGGGGTLLGYQVAGPDTSPKDASDVSWDREADVVVVGYGAAGASAAIGAAEAGADTLVLEKTAEGGGAAVESYGLMYLGGGSEVQETLGVFDTAEKMLTYLEKRYPQVESGLLESFANNSLDHHNWVRDDLGLELYAENISEYRMQYYPGGGLNYSGAEINGSINEEFEHAPMQRGHKIVGEGKTGDDLFAALDAAATDAGATVEYETPAQRLITDADGSVLGVVAEGSDGPINVRAHGDVVLATGPFDMNQEMVEQHAPEFANGKGGYSMIPVHDGMGIKMAQSIGADVANMGQITCDAYIYPRERVDDGKVNKQILKGMLFNQHGVRFIDESLPASDIGTEILRNQNGQAYFTLSGKMVDRMGGHPEHLEHVMTANTYTGFVQRLDQQFDVPYDSVNETIGVYNGNANSGRDPVFGKDRRYLEPLWNPPHHLYDISINSDAMSFRYMTHGGVKTDLEGRVQGADGDPIQGLRAAPRTANTITGQRYDGGMGLSTTTYFGKMAGAAAAESGGTTSQ